ncbi:MAG: UbiA family prenyltransferase, partial [Thermoprotei archaeon]
GFELALWVNMLVVALFMQIGANVFNEHGDYIHGVDRVASHGFAGLIVSGEATPSEVLWVGIAFYALAAVLAVPLVIVRGIVVLVLGVFAATVGVTYSEGPLPLSRTPFGEIVVGLTMGLIEVLATELVSCGGTSWSGYLVSVPVSLLVSTILLANNIRDAQKDRLAGRRTLAVLLGVSRAQILFYSLIIASYFWAPLMWLYTGNGWLNLPLLSSPFAVLGMVRLHREGWKFGVETSSLLYLLYGVTLAFALWI